MQIVKPEMCFTSDEIVLSKKECIEHKMGAWRIHANYAKRPLVSIQKC